MVALEIEPGTFVWYTAKGLGRVQWVRSDGAAVLFWADKKSGKMERLPPNLLRPLPGNAPKGKGGNDGFAAWIKKAPLTLAAVALSECDGKVGRYSDFGDKLVDRALSPSSLDSWWDRVQPKLPILPEHFKVYETFDSVEYALLSDIVDVPLDVSTLPAWENWLIGSDNNLPPEPAPTSEVSDALADWPEDTINPALERVLWGAEQFLDSPKKSAKSALEWMDAVGRAARRCGSLHLDNQELTERSGEILARFSESIQVKEKRKEATLFWAGALSESPDRQRQLERQWQEQERQREAHAAELEKLRQERERERADYKERLDQGRQERERQKVAHTKELASLRETHASDLKRERDEREKLRRQIQALDAQMSSGRKESRLEIRQGMLLAVGDALQRAYAQDKKAEDRLGVVITTLPKVLYEGGAETLGTVGETVKYNPKFHHSPESIPSGIKVRLTAPGVVAGERVILKAKVSTEAGVC